MMFVAAKQRDKSYQIHFHELETRQEIAMRDTQVKLMNEERNIWDERDRVVEREFEWKARIAKKSGKMNYCEEKSPFGANGRVVRS